MPDVPGWEISEDGTNANLYLTAEEVGRMIEQHGRSAGPIQFQQSAMQRAFYVTPEGESPQIRFIGDAVPGGGWSITPQSRHERMSETLFAYVGNGTWARYNDNRESDERGTEMPTTPTETAWENVPSWEQATIIEHMGTVSETSWVAAHASTVLFVINNRERNDFYRSIYTGMRRYQSLTPGQLNAVTRDRERGSAPAREASLDTATYDQCEWIPNGKFSIEHGGEHITIQIHTPVRGRMQGKRLVKRNTPEGFRAFAFILSDGSLSVWRRYSTELEDSKLVEFTKFLLMALKAAHNAGQSLVWDSSNSCSVVRGNDTYRLWMEQRCRRCNRALTTPQSVQDGIGPDCSQRNVADDRTVAARQNAPVASPPRNRHASTFNPPASRQAQPAASHRAERIAALASRGPLLSELGTGEIR